MFVHCSDFTFCGLKVYVSKIVIVHLNKGTIKLSNDISYLVFYTNVGHFQLFLFLYKWNSSFHFHQIMLIEQSRYTEYFLDNQAGYSI